MLEEAELLLNRLPLDMDAPRKPVIGQHRRPVVATKRHRAGPVELGPALLAA